jgi:hypothetical protein
LSNSSPTFSARFENETHPPIITYDTILMLSKHSLKYIKTIKTKNNMRENDHAQNEPTNLEKKSMRN